MTAEQPLRAYKRQPIIEKRFSQMKTDFSVIPVYLKSVSRIQALLAVYFVVLIVQTLLDRDLRLAMQRADVTSLPRSPEARACRPPTTRKVLDLFADIPRHKLKIADQSDERMITHSCLVQQQILRLLGMSPKSYGK
jgi:transposase